MSGHGWAYSDDPESCKGGLECGEKKDDIGNCLKLFPHSNFPVDAQCCYDATTG